MFIVIFMTSVTSMTSGFIGHTRLVACFHGPASGSNSNHFDGGQRAIQIRIPVTSGLCLLSKHPLRIPIKWRPDSFISGRMVRKFTVI